ncbi:MAG: hypothetical protein AB2A00_33050 [Myxococcota bacterium]
MATTRVSISMREEVLAEARRVAGSRGLSAFIDAAVWQRLQARRIEKLETELAARHGRVPTAASRKANRTRWPR